MIEIIDPGLLTTVQDLGRPGNAALGVPPSGAVDRPSLLAANALVGNSPGMACLETTLTGVSLRMPAGGVFAVTGAPATVKVDGAEVPFGEAFAAGQGSVVEVGPAAEGVRSYVAFAGGLDAESVLGSRSTDLLTGLGPQPLASTVAVSFGPSPAVGQSGDRDPSAGPGSGNGIPAIAADPLLRVVPGPRADRFADGALQALEAGQWTVSPRSNRIGVRIEGEPLPVLDAVGELRSEGIVTGSIQVPPGGLPTVMLNDRPTTGGYPVVAVVVEQDLRIAGQLRPGSPVRFSLG
ncbi:MAG: biotin-dependent carboxyltransferase family protein [Actinomycetes bacterium]